MPEGAEPERGVLEQLAALHGVALEYHDIHGARVRAPRATLVQLLGAMGVAAHDPIAVEASFVAAQAARWREPMPPAIVIPALEREWSVRLNLPPELDAARLEWRVLEETGAEHGGAFEPRTLPALESATLDEGRMIARPLAPGLALATGYHRLAIAGERVPALETMLISAPRACHSPLALEGGARVWGLAAQLYGVRSERNWGVGDYTDLRSLVELCGARGGSIVAVNPLHALFPHDSEHASPYSPSSRLFNNWLYLDVEACEDLRECDDAHALVRSAGWQARLQALRAAPLVDYAGVAAVKRQVLERLYAHFRERHLAPPTARGAAFRAYQAAAGPGLRRHALFEAIQEAAAREDPSCWGWPAWPEALRHPASPEVARFEAEHPERIEYYEYLQWQIDRQLGAAGRRSYELGLGVGLCEDLAVSVDQGGAETWANQSLYALDASVGAPPDDFNLKGQDWGLAPVIPRRQRAAAYAPFIATLRANMVHAGALRVDHVMGLMRLFWIPAGAQPSEGAYVGYPFADLLGILALESLRNRCLVIGEDLGTVPDEVRHALGKAGVLSYRLLYFEHREGGEFKAPAEYPAQAIVAASTHDLPTLAGWWEGRDLTLRAALELFPSDEMRQAQIVARAQDRARLLLALEREALLPEGATPNPVSLPALTPEFARALQIYLARTPAQLMVVQLEDVLVEREQANLPGTVDGHPNWRRKLSLGLESLAAEARFVDTAQALERERGRPRLGRAPARATPGTRIPRATYRLQFSREFTFDDAAALVPYLAELGVSHVYCSPYLRARPGSAHGYDIIDHDSLNPEIGNRDNFDRFVRALRAHGMGQILDMVPNHMGVMGADNAWWMDVLENGPASPYAEYFDIEWSSTDPDHAGKLFVPVLGAHYGEALERGELKLAFEPVSGSFAVWYAAHRLPIDPREYPRLLERALRLLAPGSLAPELTAELQSLSAAFGHLPPRHAEGAEPRAERQRDKELLKARLARFAREQPGVAEALERAVRQMNGTPGERASFGPLHELLEAQAWRAAHWRVAVDEINYRRFFDINDLAALRMENEAVFEATHRFALELAAEGSVDGLRIDHPDGLYDPAQYFRRLQDRYAQLAGTAALRDDRGRALYVLVEKITSSHEDLPDAWPVHGTTGYRFATVLNGLFVQGGARARLDRVWRAFVREEALEFEEAAYRGRRAVLRGALAGELQVLGRRLLRIARADWRTRDFTLPALREALAEVLSRFPVYRTYVAERPSAQDTRFVQWAVARAKRLARSGDPSVFDFVKRVLLIQPVDGAPQSAAAEYRAFAMRFQQLASPVAAKGVEDTAFYVFNRLASLNDVGGDPDEFGMSPAAFHGASTDRAARWPHTMLASSSHDSKRSEDVRARLNVLSEMPAAWRLLLRRWQRLNRSRRRVLEDGPAPSRNDEYLLYQTLLGSFPAEPPGEQALAAYRARIAAYMCKVAREAKQRTSWINPDAEYENALAEFVRALLTRSPTNLFLEDLAVQAREFAWYGALNGVSAALLKCASPGVPDFFQGSELIELALVDPDNRRPVDFARRRALLGELKGLAAGDAQALANGLRDLLHAPHDGRAKLWTIWRALSLREARPQLFERGEYRPIAVSGARSANVIAFARRLGAKGVIVVAGRLFASLGLARGEPPVGEAWQDTEIDLGFLGAGTLTDAISGAACEPERGKLRVSRAFMHFPGALLYFPAAQGAESD